MRPSCNFMLNYWYDVPFLIDIYIYIYIYILRGFKTSDDAFRLSYSVAFGCSIRPFLDLFHSWLCIFHLPRFFGNGLVFFLPSDFEWIIIFGSRFWDTGLISILSFISSRFCNGPIKPKINLTLFFLVALRPNAGGPSLSWDFQITHNDVSQSVGLLWSSNQLIIDTSTWQHTTLTTDKHPCPRWDSNPQSQQASGRRPTP